MQDQTPVRKKAKKKKPQPRVAKPTGNNPYRPAQPKPNNSPGFTFGGSVY